MSLTPPDVPGPVEPTLVEHGPDDRETIIGISFTDSFRAHQFLTAMQGLHAAGGIQLRDAVIVTKDADGDTRVRETVDLQPGRAALSGAVWTGLIGLLLGGPVGWIAGLGVGAGAGAVAARVVDVGIPDAWVAWFRAAVAPGTFTVVVLTTSLDIEQLVREATRFPGAQLVHANLGPGVVARLEAALGGEASEA
jgi:uncharacterized membrane protein